MRTQAIDFASRFCLRFPSIIQAAVVEEITTPKLVAAVSNANGLGSFATGLLSTEQVQSGIRKIKQLTTKPFITNLVIPNKTRKDDSLFSPPKDNFDGIIEVLLSENVPIVSFIFGNPEPTLISRFKEKKIYLIGTASSLEEAKTLSESGIDAIVAQGHAAGGYREKFFSLPRHAYVDTLTLVPQLANNIERPIIAAGGIVEGRSIAAVFALGAAAVQMGTAFLATEESGQSSTYLTRKNLTVAQLLEQLYGEFIESTTQNVIRRKQLNTKTLDELRLMCDQHKVDYKLFEDKIPLKTAKSGVAEYGISLSEAAPTLIIKTDEGMIAAIIRGDTRVSFNKLKELLKTKNIRLAKPEEIYNLTNTKVGDVSLINDGLKTFVDKKLLEKDYVYGGCGVPNHTLKIKTADLVSITNATVIDFTDLKENTTSNDCQKSNSCR